MTIPGLGPVLSAFLLSPAPPSGPEDRKVETVEIRDRVFHLNGQPFFPIFSWLQDPANLPRVRGCGMNATAGYWPGAGGTRDVADYLDRVGQAGLLGVMPFDPRLKGHPRLLAYIHDDEPDLPRQVSDAAVEPGAGLRINRKTPLWKLLDGDLTSWSVLDPLEGARLTFRWPQPVTVRSLAVTLTVSKGLSLAREIVFEAGGAELLKATLEPKPGRQTFPLPRPATFQELALRVAAVTPGDREWGSLGEVEGFDAEGRNVLLCPPGRSPAPRRRRSPGSTPRSRPPTLPAPSS